MKLFPIITLSLLYVSAKQSPPDQFEANCPYGCKCDRTVIECRKVGATDTELFRHAQPLAYPNLDSLIITENRLGDLPAENIFGGDVRHERLSLINLTNNGITSFGAQTFIGASRVEYLYLEDNRLNAFLDSQPLHFLTALKVINLKAAFDGTPRRRSDLVRILFANDRDFIELNEIILSDNGLEHIHSDTFCKVRSLSRLDLKNNRLTSFVFDKGCIRSLSLLDLRQNRFFGVPSSLWKPLPRLNTIDLSLNPLHCDCGLQEFHSFALDDENEFLSQQETVCASPRSLRGKTLFEVSESFCTKRGSFLHWLVLLAVGTAVLFVYRRVRHNRTALPFISSGYTQLNNNNTSDTAQPTFV